MITTEYDLITWKKTGKDLEKNQHCNILQSEIRSRRKKPICLHGCIGSVLFFYVTY